jgi:integron integrase
MNISQAVEKLTDAMRLRHLARSTEECYQFWLQSFMRWLASHKIKGTSAQKVEAFLTMQARRGVAASTQNQALNALLFFYEKVLGTPLEAIDAARVRRPATVRTALSVEETRALLAAMEDHAGYPTRLVAHLLYGAGLRVSEPLELRIKDVDVVARRLVIRGAKGGKDRAVELPRTLVEAVEAQLRVARAVWRGDAAAGLPVAMPGLLARKSPRLALTEAWAWVFPAHRPMKHPRTGEAVRWRMHEVNVQRAVRAAAAKAGLAGKVTPHVLRHCYATHAHEAGAPARNLQEAMGHTQLETTMRYLSPSENGVRSPLDALAAG